MAYLWTKVDCASLPLRSMSGNAAKVLLYLAGLCTDKQESCASYGRLCSDLAISRRSAIYSIKQLEEYEILRRTNLVGQCLTVRWLKCVSVGRSTSPEQLPLSYQNSRKAS